MSQVRDAVPVQVLGETIRLRGGDRAEVEALAHYVDRRIAEIRSRNEALSLRSLLILTSLNIAEDLFHARREHEQWLRTIEDRTRRLRETVEASLLPPVVSGRRAEQDPP